jgi:CHRD domain
MNALYVVRRNGSAKEPLMLRTAFLAPVLAFGLAFGLAAQASAEVVQFKTTMTSAQEVPPNNSHGSGDAQAQLDAATKTLTYKVTWKGLTGPATMAHFHGPAASGEEAPVIIPLGNSPKSPITGKAQLTDDQVKEFMDGKVYVNVHTAAHPGGEIRGQMAQAK